MLARLALLVLAIAALQTAIACGGTSSPAVIKESPQGEQTYRNKEYGFSLRHPAGWRLIQPSGFSDFVVMWGAPERVRTGIGLSVLAVEARNPQVAAREVLKTIKLKRTTNSLGADPANYTGKMKVELTKRGDRPVVRWSEAFTEEGERYRELHYAVFTEEQVYHLFYTALPRDYAADEDKFMNVLESFTLE